MKNNKIVKIIPVIVIILVLIVLGVTYSLWSTSDSQGGKNTVNTVNCLDIEFLDTTNGISLGNAVPMSDELGLKTTPHTFTIENKCNREVRYDLNIESLNISNETKYLNINYLDVSINDEYVEKLGNYNQTDSLLEANVAYDTRMVRTSTIAANDTITLNLKVWLDESTPNSEQGSTWQGMITVNGIAMSDEYIGITGVQYLQSIASNNTDTMYYDGASYTDPNTNEEIVDNNLRYMGANPNNYVLFNDELWRIIGVMNNVDDGTGVKESRIKLIRNESLGEFPYYDSCADENWIDNGDGTYSCSDRRFSNNWPGSTINEILTTYYNNGTHAAYHGFVEGNNVSIAHDYPTSTIDFTSSGLSSTSKNLIENATYYLGGYKTFNTEGNNQFYYQNITTLDSYSLERLNQGSTNELIWTGNLGLMYPSDYGYSSNGTIAATGVSCKTITLWSWRDSAYANCKNNSWLYKSTLTQYFMTASADYYGDVSCIYYDGSVKDASTRNVWNITPVLYLKSQVKIIGGKGTSSNPYQLAI
ncbi:MAG: hypothetical protein IJ574_06125 [Bacilli bacterium]|nr:hypothetical protein [Bacilli bacterium]